MKLECVSEPVINPAQAVPRIQCPSLERFRSDFLDPQKPVIIEKIIDHWPAFTEHPWRYWWYFFILWGLSYKKMYVCILFTLSFSKHRLLPKRRWLPDGSHWSGIQIHGWRVVTEAYYSKWVHRRLHFKNSKMLLLNLLKVFFCGTKEDILKNVSKILCSYNGSQ